MMFGNCVARIVKGDTMSTATANEVNKLIKGCKATDLQSRAYLDLAFHSGLRPAELCDLDWADINGNRVTVRCGKGGKRRVVALAETYGWVELWREKSGGTGYVFRTRAEKQWQTSHVRRLLARLSERAAVKIHPHEIRHAHALMVWNETKDLGLVNRQLGHARLATTDVYLKGRGVDLDRVAASASRLPKIADSITGGGFKPPFSCARVVRGPAGNGPIRPITGNWKTMAVGDHSLAVAPNGVKRWGFCTSGPDRCKTKNVTIPAAPSDQAQSAAQPLSPL